MDCQHRVGAGGKVSGTHPCASTSYLDDDALNAGQEHHGVECSLVNGLERRLQVSVAGV